MNQELCFSTSLINYLSERLPVYTKQNVLDVIEFIGQNKIVSDTHSTHFKIMFNLIEQIDDKIKSNTLKTIFDNWINKKIFFVDYQFKNDPEDEYNLTKRTGDKIFFNPCLEKSQVKKMKIKYHELEIHTESTFLSPAPSDRLKHLPTIIFLEKDIYYDIEKIFSPFLSGSRTIRIEDPYLPNNKASQNFFKILPHIKNSNIKLVFLEKSKYIEEKAREKEYWYKDFLKNIDQKKAEGFIIDYSEHFKKKSHRERYIFTDDVQIYIPGGLDFLDPDGFISDQNNRDDIPARNEIRIEKRRNI